MTFEEAHDWCLDHTATVYFHPKETLDDKGGIPTMGKVQFTYARGGSAGDTLVAAVKNWIESNESFDSDAKEPAQVRN